MFGLGSYSNLISGGAAGGAGGGILGIVGSAIQAKLAMKTAQQNRDFQERMSNTAYQRTMADMEAAGLNPMLAAKIGGASTPPGAMANIAPMDFTKDVTTAIAARRSNAELKLIRAQAAKTTAEGTLIKAQVPRALAEEEVKSFGFDKLRKLFRWGVGTAGREYGDWSARQLERRRRDRRGHLETQGDYRRRRNQ